MMKYMLIVVVLFNSVVFTLLSADNTVLVVFKTNYGNIELEIYPSVAPNLTANFLALCKDSFYNGTSFHYAEKGFMIAGGDANTKDGDRTTDGTGKPGSLKDEINATALGLDTLLVKNSFLGHHLPDNSTVKMWTMKRFLQQQGYSFENSLPSIPNEYGVVSMASNMPNTNGSHFFIVTSKEGTPWLNGKNTVIGRVRNGMDVVHEIEQLPHDNNHNPLEEFRAVISDTILSQ